jgi:alkylation response protein AidB-like acyl-CoA dehydrogenase
VINAHKWFTTGANSAAFTTVFCETDPTSRQAPPVLVDHRAHRHPGYQIVRVVPDHGHTGGGHCEIRLTDVRVPQDNLLGPRGDGFLIAQKRLGPGRIFHCMRWLGQAQRAFELMCERANTRFAHGSLLARRARSSATSPSRPPRSRPPG